MKMVVISILIGCIATSCGFNYDYGREQARKMDDRKLRRSYLQLGANGITSTYPIYRAYEDEMENRGLIPKANRTSAE